jgi:tetraacyldisaccharide 4'-kinase
MAEPKHWQSASHPLSLGLRPVSWAYQLIEASNRFFVKPQHPGKPVICVGNLTAGGAGKTPVVRFYRAAMAALYLLNHWLCGSTASTIMRNRSAMNR